MNDLETCLVILKLLKLLLKITPKYAFLHFDNIKVAFKSIKFTTILCD